MGQSELRQRLMAMHSGYGQVSTGPNGVHDQSVARISRAISLLPVTMRSALSAGTTEDAPGARGTASS
jgi:hypothetical protein